ncbi:MAG: helix-turn-helix transcriptional regulator [Bacteroidales bacterium]|nr:helix-turn-helix transcriptional regulator [Bacteroidales bacterium]
MSKGAFKALVKEAKERDVYWVEHAILEFTTDLYQLMQQKGTSKTELADILGTSQAYITKVFSGNAKFTIQSMVKLTRALGGKLHIRVASKEERVYWMGSVDGGKNEDGPAWIPQRSQDIGGKKYEAVAAPAD